MKIRVEVGLMLAWIISGCGAEDSAPTSRVIQGVERERSGDESRASFRMERIAPDQVQLAPSERYLERGRESHFDEQPDWVRLLVVDPNHWTSTDPGVRATMSTFRNSLASGFQAPHSPAMLTPEALAFSNDSLSILAQAMDQPGMNAHILAMLSGTPADELPADWFDQEPLLYPRLFWAEETASRGLKVSSGRLGREGASESNSQRPQSRTHMASSNGEFAAIESSPRGANGVIKDVGGGHVLRYACCGGVEVLDEPSAGGTEVTTLARGQEVWVLDLLPSTGLVSTFNQVHAQNQQCLNNPSSCRDLVTQMAQNTNINYYAKVFVPGANKTGYAHLQALFRRPVVNEKGTVSLEVGYRKIAETLAASIQDVFHPAGCGSASNLVNVQAGFHDLIFHPSSSQSTNCDDYVDCPRWKIRNCPEESEGDALDKCRYVSVDECDGPVPNRAASTDHKYCVRNTCRFKGTCTGCRDWFQATGQNQTGWQTTQQLVNACIQSKTSTNDICVDMGNCVDICQYEMVMTTENPFSCAKYVAPHDSRQYTNPRDYECGEYPVGTTHPDLYQFLTTGEWAGQADYERKELDRIDILGKIGRFNMGRLGSQKAFSFSTYDLTLKAVKSYSVPKELTSRNFWFAFDANASPAFTNDQKRMLWVSVCAHLPGVPLYGPKYEYNLADTPLGLIKELEFGTGNFDRLRLCALGGLWLGSDLEPRFEWQDADLNLYGIDYGGVKLTHGPTAYFIALGGKVIPVVGEILSKAVLTELVSTTVAQAIVNNTDAGSWLVNFLLETYKARVSDALVKRLNEQTKQAMASLEFDGQERLKQACDRLRPPVPSSHPYYYFYEFMHAQCELARSSHQRRLFEKNAAAAATGCYGAHTYLNPADHASDPWWGKYLGQSWWEPTSKVPDQGCRIAAEIDAELDSATWPVLSCAVANVNWWVNNGLYWYNDPVSFAAPGQVPLSHGELVQSMGELNYMISMGCRSFGKSALYDLYGNGQDLIDLYNETHPGSPIGGWTGGGP